MKDVSPDYLLWLFRQDWIKDWPDIYAYLVKNQAALLMEDSENDERQHSEGFDSLEDYEKYR